jgi:glycosyltransferase involved in cell wall biosynthesis
MEDSMHPTVSIVIRVYNRERYIGRAIESVLSQTYTDFDLLVWDDGSTDKTAKETLEYAKKDRRVRIAFYNHRGAVKALKSALADTFGTYLCWVDGDDMLAPTALEETVAVLEENPTVGMVYTDYQVIDASDRIIGFGNRCLIPYSKVLPDFKIFQFRLIRRSVFERSGGIDESFRCAENYDLCLHIAELTEVRHIPKPLYFYRIHEDSVSQNMDAGQIHFNRDAVSRNLEWRGLSDRFELDPQIRSRFSLQRRKSNG